VKRGTSRSGGGFCTQVSPLDARGCSMMLLSRTGSPLVTQTIMVSGRVGLDSMFSLVEFTTVKIFTGILCSFQTICPGCTISRKSDGFT